VGLLRCVLLHIATTFGIAELPYPVGKKLLS
jgi:hypothetical protein